MAAVVPPRDARLPVFLHIALALYEQTEFRSQFLAGYAVTLEDVEQIGGREHQPFIQQIADMAFTVCLAFPRPEYLVQHLIILVIVTTEDNGIG